MDKPDTMKVSVDFGVILEGGQFTFIIGSEKRRFSLHSALVSKHSEPLRSMMSGGMTESTSNTVILDDIDSETFVRFAEYLYSGTYTTIPAETCSETQERSFAQKCADFRQKLLVTHGRNVVFSCVVCQQYANVQNSLEFPYHNSSCKNSKPGYTPRCIWCGIGVIDREFVCNKCDDILLAGTSSIKSLPKGWSQFKVKRFGTSGVEERATSPNSQGSETAKIDLSAHAKVWVLADRYQVSALKRLSLRRLHHDLIAYQLKLEGVKEIVELIEYVYENMFAPEPETSAVGEVGRKSCELRDLVTEYAACQADLLVETQAFCIMLQGGGDLASDFAKALIKRGD